MDSPLHTKFHLLINTAEPEISTSLFPLSLRKASYKVYFCPSSSLNGKLIPQIHQRRLHLLDPVSNYSLRIASRLQGQQSEPR